MAPEIEFVLGCAKYSNDEEPVIDVIDSRARSVPRWLAAAALVALIVLGGAGFARAAQSAAHRHGMAVVEHETAAPTEAESTGAERAVRIDASVTDAVAVAGAAGHQLDVVRVRSLTALNTLTGRITTSSPVPELASSAIASRYRLVSDHSNNRLWLIDEGTSDPAEVIEFDAKTLHRIGSTIIASTIQAAAVLGGKLYLATAEGVLALDSEQLIPRPVPGARGFIADVAVDGAHGRLLIIDGALLVAERPDGRERVTRTQPGPNGQIAVAGNSIWIATRPTGDGAEVTISRLDSNSLTPTGSAREVVNAIGAGTPEFVASSTSSIWLRKADSGDSLICMNATTGAIGEYFAQAPGMLTATPLATTSRPTLFMSTDGAIRPIEPASTCT